MCRGLLERGETGLCEGKHNHGHSLVALKADIDNRSSSSAHLLSNARKKLVNYCLPYKFVKSIACIIWCML